MKNKVFGIGLSKTGTSSLGEALNQLGIKTIHYPNDEITLKELQSGNFNLTILQQYQGVVDTPVVPYYAQLDSIFPGSKFILTTRELGPWLASVKKHWETSPSFEDQPSRKNFQQFIRTAVYGCTEFNAARFEYVYHTHFQNVLTYFKDRPDDLLILDICAGEGWRELCTFLEMPLVTGPFPHANEWMHKLIKATEEIKEIIPAEDCFILIDDQMLGKDFTMDRRFIPFTENDGIYAGPPSNDKSAITEFEKTLSRYDPDYLVVGWPSFWWFDIYTGFASFLRSRFESVLENDEMVVFRLL